MSIWSAISFNTVLFLLSILQIIYFLGPCFQAPEVSYLYQ